MQCATLSEPYRMRADARMQGMFAPPRPGRGKLARTVGDKRHPEPTPLRSSANAG